MSFIILLKSFSPFSYKCLLHIVFLFSFFLISTSFSLSFIIIHFSFFFHPVFLSSIVLFSSSHFFPPFSSPLRISLHLPPFLLSTFLLHFSSLSFSFLSLPHFLFHLSLIYVISFIDFYFTTPLVLLPSPSSSSTSHYFVSLFFTFPFVFHFPFSFTHPSSFTLPYHLLISFCRLSFIHLPYLIFVLFLLLLSDPSSSNSLSCLFHLSHCICNSILI